MSNHLGSASLELNEAGDIISYEEYYPYGCTSYQAVDASIHAAAKRYRYTGKERDEETGLAYHGARYYACWLGRWCSADPVATLNRYDYVMNRPVILYDPNGRHPVVVGLVVVGMVIGGVMVSNTAHAPISEQQVAQIEPEGFIEGNARIVQGMALGGAVASGGALVVGGARALASMGPKVVVDSAKQLLTKEGLKEGAVTLSETAVEEVKEMAVEETLNSIKPGLGDIGGSVGPDIDLPVARRSPVEAGDAGTFRSLESDARPYDGTQHDHLPSNKSNQTRLENNLEEEFGVKATPEMKKFVRREGTAGETLDETHRETSPTYGGRVRGNFEQDALNPEAGFARDLDVWERENILRGVDPYKMSEEAAILEILREDELFDPVNAIVDTMRKENP